MKVRLSNSNIFKLLLTLYVIWGNIIIGIKWEESVLNVMNTVSRIVMISIIVLIAFQILNNSGLKHSRTFLKDYVFLAVVIIVYIVTGENTLVFTVGLIIAVKGVNYDEVYKVYFKTMLFALFSSVITCSFGLSQNIVSYFSYGVGYSWGTHHANNLAYLIASLYFCFCYLYLKEKRLLQTVLAAVLIVVVWNVTVSRTACALIAMYPVMNLLIQVTRKTGTSKWIKYSKQIVLVMALLSILVSIFYVQFYGGLYYNGTFQSRFAFGYSLMNKYGIHLFGSKIEYIGTYEARKLGLEVVLLDNAYLTLLINYGIIATIIVFYILTKNISKAYKEKNFELLTIMIIYIISGISENGMLTVIGNATLLYFYSNTTRKYVSNWNRQSIKTNNVVKLYKSLT